MKRAIALAMIACAVAMIFGALSFDWLLGGGEHAGLYGVRACDDCGRVAWLDKHHDTLFVMGWLAALALVADAALVAVDALAVWRGRSLADRWPLVGGGVALGSSLAFWRLAARELDDYSAGYGLLLAVAGTVAAYGLSIAVHAIARPRASRFP
jgi:hypothetical protein